MPDLAFVEDDPGSSDRGPAGPAGAHASGAPGGAGASPAAWAASAEGAPQGALPGGGPAPGGAAALNPPHPAPGSGAEEPPPDAPPTPSDDMDLEERGSPGGTGSGEDAALPDMDLGSPERPADGPGTDTCPLPRPPADPRPSQGGRAACNRATSKQSSASVVPVFLGSRQDL